MGVLYMFGRDGKVFTPPFFWYDVPVNSAGGKHGMLISKVRVCIVIFVILSVGASGFYYLEGEQCIPGKKATWFSKEKPAVCRKSVTPLDAFYFMFITLTTIGYGDVTPTNVYSRIWVCCIALLGTGLMSTFLDICGAWRVFFFDTRRVSQGVECFVCLAILFTAGTVVFTNFEGLGYYDSLYLALATSTTVGYGDVKPITQAGRILTIVYAALSLSVFGYITSCVGDLIQPDSDTSIGFGGSEDEWGLSIADRFLGRSIKQHKNKEEVKRYFSLSRNTTLRVILGFKVLFLILAAQALVMGLQPDFTPLDAFYFVVMTLTTVGYGDVVTTSPVSRLFEVLLAILGLGLFSNFTGLVGEGWRERLKKHMMIERDYILCFWLLVVILSAGTCIFSFLEDIPPLDAMYLSVVTATTIGYGDFHPVTPYGKLAACVYACLSVSAMGFVCSWISDQLQDMLCSYYKEERALKAKIA